MAKSAQSKPDAVMVVPTVDLFESGREFCGFGYTDCTNRDYPQIILENTKFMRRDAVEHNPDFQQIVAWGILVNPWLRQAVVYQRAENYPDSRLAGQWSFGIGGHVLERDLDKGDTFRNAISRDIREGRVTLSTDAGKRVKNALYSCVDHLGYISIPWQVNNFHFGLVYLVHTNATVVAPNKDDFARVEMMNLRELIELGANRKEKIDMWSSAIWPLMMSLLFHD